MAQENMNTYCDDCCDFQSHNTVLPQMKDRFIASVGCCTCCVKDGAPVKDGVEFGMYTLLAWADDGEGGVCLELATADNKDLWAGFSLQCFGPDAEGGVTFYAEGGFLSHMACMPEGVTFDAATISCLRAKGLYPIKTYGATEAV